MSTNTPRTIRNMHILVFNSIFKYTSQSLSVISTTNNYCNIRKIISKVMLSNLMVKMRFNDFDSSMSEIRMHNFKINRMNKCMITKRSV